MQRTLAHETDDLAGTDPGRPTTRRRALLAAAIGNGIEWFDFAAYGFVAVYIGAAFFSTSDPTTQLLATFAVYGLTFVVRPLGGLYFGPLADRVGRQRVLVAVLLLMAVATGLVGVLPTYATIGVAAPVLLVVLRSLQAFSAGGEYGSATSFLVEYAAPGRRGAGTGWMMFSAVVGFMAAGLLVLLLQLGLGEETMQAWGWRVPFLLAFPLGAVGLYIRVKLEDTPEYRSLQAVGDVAAAPLREALALPRQLLVTFGIAALHGSAFYMVLTYLLSYVSITAGLGTTTGLLTCLTAGAAALALIPGMSSLSDRVGRRPILVVSSAGLALLVVPVFALIRSGTTGAFVGQAVLGLLLGSLISTSIVAMAEIFPARVRSAGNSLAYTLGVMVFGGTAPFIATWLVERTGSSLAPAFYLVGTALIGLTAALALPAPAERVTATVGQEG
ncbi:MAG: MFS transporter [Nocardioides alkalitolerans]